MADYQAFANETGADPTKVMQLHQQGNQPITALPRKKFQIGSLARHASVFKRKVNGWDWDDHQLAYFASAPNKFACDCGEEFTPPKYHKCGNCGKTWNSYVIGTGGDRHEAAIEKYVCREIPERPGMLVAHRKQAADTLDHPLTHPAVPACQKCWNASNHDSDVYGGLLHENHHDALKKEFHKDQNLELQRHPDYNKNHNGPGHYRDRAASSEGPQDDEWWKQHGSENPEHDRSRWQHITHQFRAPDYTPEHPHFEHLKAANATGPENPEWWAKSRKAPSLKPSIHPNLREKPSKTPAQATGIHPGLGDQPHPPITKPAPSGQWPYVNPVAPKSNPPKPKLPTPKGMPQFKTIQGGYADEHPEEFPYAKATPEEIQHMHHHKEPVYVNPALEAYHAESRVPPVKWVKLHRHEYDTSDLEDLLSQYGEEPLVGELDQMLRASGKK